MTTAEIKVLVERLKQSTKILEKRGQITAACLIDLSIDAIETLIAREVEALKIAEEMHESSLYCGHHERSGGFITGILNPKEMDDEP